MRAILCVLVTLLVGCSDIPEIDQYYTFDLTRTAVYGIPMTGQNSAGSISATTTNDPTDYEKHGTSPDNLRTAKITRVQLLGAENFNFNSLAYARILSGQDTLADSLYSYNGQYLLRARDLSVLQLMKVGSFTTTLEYGTLGAIADSTTLSAQFTVSLTALPR